MRTSIKACVKHLNCKLYYRQLHLKYLCKLARYWLQTVWGWHENVETCRSVIICEIIVHLLVIVQNEKKNKIMEAILCLFLRYQSPTAPPPVTYEVISAACGKCLPWGLSDQKSHSSDIELNAYHHHHHHHHHHRLLLLLLLTPRVARHALKGRSSVLLGRVNEEGCFQVVE